MMILKTIAPYTSLSLSIALLLTELAAPCVAQNTQNRVIVVNADQPNVWTLERKEAFLTIPNPNQSEVVRLQDPVTDISVSTLVVRKPPE